MAENGELTFTGERVVPGKVDADLWNEHYARYLFAARFARGERALDLGCGAGYGTALLAETAASVTGVDISPEAVAHASAQYARPNLRFFAAPCTATGLADASFDLITAFEIIEHLEDWPLLLIEARRMLAPDGQFLVSTPNKNYYGEAREGVANPYHVHEFEFTEFEAVLRQVFPSVSLFTQNHTDATVFQPIAPAGAAELRIEAESAEPATAHFYFAVCALAPQTGASAFVYIPRTANMLRERELHISKLERLLATEQAAHQELLRHHDALKEELEQANRWARESDAKVAAADAARETAHRTLEAAHSRFAADITAANEHLKRAEQTIEERTRWAQSLDAERQRLEHALAAVSASRWHGLGRKLGLGPKLDG